MADDFSELYELAADLGEAPQNLPKYLRKALERTSNKVKKGARETVRKRKGLGHAANTIEYELDGVSGDVSEMSSEIGYKEGTKSGNLGTLIEFGSPKLRPSHDLGNALLNNEDDFVYGIDQAVADAMGEVGL